MAPQGRLIQVPVVAVGKPMTYETAKMVERVLLLLGTQEFSFGRFFK
jgi:hypothetical protein